MFGLDRLFQNLNSSTQEANQTNSLQFVWFGLIGFKGWFRMVVTT